MRSMFVLLNETSWSYYRSQLLDQLLNFRQATSSVSDYMSQFEDLMLRCELQEVPWLTVTRFINGLQVDIKREVSKQSPQVLEDAYHDVLEA